MELMQLLDLNIAGDFLVMAATLMHIKSKLLLPPDPTQEAEEIEEDPRAELVRRLLEYKKFKEAANELAQREAQQKHLFARVGDGSDSAEASGDELFEASLFDLITAFTKVLKDVPKDIFHQVIKDEFTVSEKMHDIIHLMVEKPRIIFTDLFKSAKNKIEIITTFLAVLELIRLKEVIVAQPAPFAEIEIVRNIEPIKPGVSNNGQAGS
jgi:segregation and condensation protein A